MRKIDRLNVQSFTNGDALLPLYHHRARAKANCMMPCIRAHSQPGIQLQADDVTSELQTGM